LPAAPEFIHGKKSARTGENVLQAEIIQQVGLHFRP